MKITNTQLLHEEIERLEKINFEILEQNAKLIEEKHCGPPRSWIIERENLHNLIQYQKQELARLNGELNMALQRENQHLHKLGNIKSIAEINLPGKG